MAESDALAALLSLLPQAKSQEEAEYMIAACVRMHIGEDGADAVIRKHVKGIPARQIAREDRVNRKTTQLQMDSFDAVCAAMGEAQQQYRIQHAGRTPQPPDKPA